MQSTKTKTGGSPGNTLSKLVSLLFKNLVDIELRGSLVTIKTLELSVSFKKTAEGKWTLHRVL